MNKIWARNGSVAVIPPDLAGTFASIEFPMFSSDRSRLEPRWFDWMTRTRAFWALCDEKSRGSSGKNRIRPDQFLSITISLPSVELQREVAAHLDGLADKTARAKALGAAQAADVRALLLSRFETLTADADRRPLGEIAPLTRRPVDVDMASTYDEIGIRSFGRGVFHKLPTTGADLGDKRVFWIAEGDLLFNIVFAWEGAVAVAGPDDSGRIGSHRFLTCVPDPALATSPFLRFFFLTDEGIARLGEASPGGAGRNKTLGLKALNAVRVPVPPLEIQREFDALQLQVSMLTDAAPAQDLDALLASAVARAFSAE